MPESLPSIGARHNNTTALPASVHASEGDSGPDQQQMNEENVSLPSLIAGTSITNKQHAEHHGGEGIEMQQLEKTDRISAPAQASRAGNSGKHAELLAVQPSSPGVAVKAGSSRDTSTGKKSLGRKQNSGVKRRSFAEAININEASQLASDMAMINDMKKRFFNPEGPFRRSWDGSMLVLLMYSILSVPFTIAFDINPVPSSPLFIFNRIVDLAFMLDVVFNFRTAVPVEGELVYDQKVIASKYLKGWFTIDFISSVPIDVIFDVLSYDNDLTRLNKLLRFLRFSKMFRLLRLARFARFNRYLGRLEEVLSLNPGVVRILKLSIWILILSHLSACTWFFLATLSPEQNWATQADKVEGAVWDQGIAIQYLVSIYWAFTTMSTVGYGDIVPVTVPETMFSILQMLAGASIFAYIVGNMASLLGALDSRSAAWREKMEGVTVYMQEHGVPFSMRNKVRAFYEYAMSKNSLYSESKVLDDLSDSLRVQVALYIYRDIVKSVRWLAESDRRFSASLVTNLQPIHMAKDEACYFGGETGKVLYMLHSGSISLRLFDKEVALLQPGATFGEEALLAPRIGRHLLSAIAVKDCELYILNLKAFTETCKDFPESELGIIEVCLERLKALKTFCLLPDQEEGKPGAIGKQVSAAGTQVWAGKTTHEIYSRMRLDQDSLDPSSLNENSPVITMLKVIKRIELHLCHRRKELRRHLRAIVGDFSTITVTSDDIARSKMHSASRAISQKLFLSVDPQDADRGERLNSDPLRKLLPGASSMALTGHLSPSAKDNKAISNLLPGQIHASMSIEDMQLQSSPKSRRSSASGRDGDSDSNSGLSRDGTGEVLTAKQRRISLTTGLDHPLHEAAEGDELGFDTMKITSATITNNTTVRLTVECQDCGCTGAVDVTRRIVQPTSDEGR